MIDISFVNISENLYLGFFAISVGDATYYEYQPLVGSSCYLSNFTLRALISTDVTFMVRLALIVMKVILY